MTEEELHARCDEYHISDDELATLNRMMVPFLDQLRRVFGTRMKPVMANLLGSALAHGLQDDTDGFFLFSTVNDWLAVVAKTHRGVAFELGYADALENPTGPS